MTKKKRFTFVNRTKEFLHVSARVCMCACARVRDPKGKKPAYVEEEKNVLTAATATATDAANDANDDDVKKKANYLLCRFWFSFYATVELYSRFRCSQ